MSLPLSSASWRVSSRANGAMIVTESSTLIEDRKQGLSRLADTDETLYSLPTCSFDRLRHAYR